MGLLYLTIHVRQLTAQSTYGHTGGCLKEGADEKVLNLKEMVIDSGDIPELSVV
jgi:hypothetical protein